MVKRELSSEINESFFLFGARGTGKSTWLENEFKPKNNLWIDLLDPDEETRYSKDPKLLLRQVQSLVKEGAKPDWIIIDEIQKVSKLLDVAHSLIERYKICFALTGSSARKLKRGHANLLGGRANIFALYPFTHSELGESFDLNHALNWGTLPKIVHTKSDLQKTRTLRGYTQVYLKEEILVEQLVRNLVPFKGFLEVSAQMSGERLNYEKIARDIGVDNKTVQSYFDILEETYLGFRLLSYDNSVRKSQLTSPKFYWFDLGVQRFLSGQIHNLLSVGSSDFGKAFECFLINEILRYNSYHELDYKLSYLQTKHGAEIDLILSRGRETIAIEIKSSLQVNLVEVRALEVIASDLPYCKKIYYLSLDPISQAFGKVICLHWKDFFSHLKFK